jgi:hypothetical protein
MSNNPFESLNGKILNYMSILINEADPSLTIKDIITYIRAFILRAQKRPTTLESVYPEFKNIQYDVNNIANLDIKDIKEFDTEIIPHLKTDGKKETFILLLMVLIKKMVPSYKERCIDTVAFNFTTGVGCNIKNTDDEIFIDSIDEEKNDKWVDKETQEAIPANKPPLFHSNKGGRK